MDLKGKLAKMTGLLGRPEKPMGKANLEALVREIDFLESELDKLQTWATLAADDRSGSFPMLIDRRIQDVMNQYHGVPKDGLERLQIQHTLLRELQYTYMNAAKMKDAVTGQLKEKRESYAKANKS